MQAPKENRPKSMEYLPREVFHDILSRLPIKSLLQCKLVCRAWHSLTKDPNLVSMRFSQLSENDPCLILHCDYPIRNQLYYLELSARNEDNRRVNIIRVPMLPEFDVVGSCKGLLCLCDYLTKSQLYVYNPFTMDYKELPTSIDFQNSDVFGFGFHPITKEYKVVKIVYYRTRPRSVLNRGGIVPPESHVKIFTLGSPAWRSLGKIPYIFFRRSSQVLVSGRLHWHTWPHRSDPGRLLISFDLADERFRVIPKPDCGGLDRCSFSLVVLGGCLSAAVRRNGQIEIWVMKDYDVKESWSKEFSIGIHVPRGLEQDMPRSFTASKFHYHSSMIRVLCLMKNGNILLEYRGRALISYDPTSGTFDDLLFNEMPNWFEAVVHESNLTLIDM